jgi:tRNA threonylcarbamoyladenosine biosynthesis protein TsaB
MYVLAVDTTTERESVALVAQGDVLGEVRLRRAEHHSRRLLPAIELLLQNVGIAPTEVDAYAVTAGPGSFTGLRVGISTVQGLALALDRPCLGLSTLDVLAARIQDAAPFLVALMEGGRGQVYAAAYDAFGKPLGEPRCDAPELALQGLPKPAAFFGDGVPRSRAAIAAVYPDATFPRRSLFLAGTLGLLAEPRLASGGGVSAAELRPLYLRDAHIRAAPA